MIHWRLLLLPLAVLLAPPAQATEAAAPTVTGATAADADLLPPEQAFRFELTARGNRVLRLNATVADGYYLYQERIRIEARTAGLELGPALMPRGQMHDDPLLGAVPVYRGQTSLELPIASLGAGTDALSVAVTSQGCADLGVCYPPDTRVLQVALPALAPAPPAAALGALERLGRAFGAGDDVAAPATQAEFLPVDDAFRVRAVADGAGAVSVSFDIADGYYLYRSRMGFETPSPPGTRVARVAIPPGEPKVDDFFGEQQVFYGGVVVTLALDGAVPGRAVDLRIAYQGCADAGLCYPPQQRVLPVVLAAAGAPSALLPGTAEVAAVRLSETDRLARSLVQDALGWVLLSFFGAGLLLAFTPCVLPMVPILSAIIAGQEGPPSGRRGFALSLVYVLAMSLTYTAAGVAAGLFGQNLQAVFQHPAVLIGFSALFVVLSLAMFGVYQLQLPVAWQTRLAALSCRQRGGNYAGVGAMGVLSALIVGPCVAAPLAAALIVIGTTGDPLRGGLALFALSLGMGAPLLAVGAFGTALLPRAGSWMTLVRNVFGLMLLAVAIYLLARLLPDPVTVALWAVLALLTALVLALSGSARGRRPGALRLAGAAAAFVCASVLAVGAATGARDPLRPLAGLSGTDHAGLAFQRVKTVGELERVISDASRDGRPVMLDFYADWCVSCKEMERDTFTSAAVHAALGDTVLVQADVTVYDDDDKALLERFGLYGPPAILFFGTDGAERRDLRVIGFMDAATFGPHVSRAGGS